MFNWSNPDGIELERVPTMDELVRRQLARVVIETTFTAEGKPKKSTKHQASPTGQQLIYDAQKRNAERLKEHYDHATPVRRPAPVEATEDDWPF